MNQLGIVTIGRNEGQRLYRCLTSVVGRGSRVIYVDSNSTDGSAELARSVGAEVVALDVSRPICVPRARNEGFERLCELDPDVRFVQFIDGDCEVVDGWIEEGRRVLEERSDVAIVTGRRRERFREQSIYNRLADLEWNTPVGETKSSHGDIMVRVEAFRQIGGFDPEVFVGEDYEFCVRLREKGWVLLRIDAEMTLHDMAMTRFTQWWRRCVRTGYSYPDIAHVHGKSPERHFIREVRSILLWGAALPLAVLILAWPTQGASFMLLGAYLLLYWRVWRYGARRGWSASDARLYALFCVLAKFPMLVGFIKYWISRITRGPKPLIEYKGPTSADLSREPCSSTSSKQSNASS